MGKTFMLVVLLYVGVASIVGSGESVDDDDDAKISKNCLNAGDLGVAKCQPCDGVSVMILKNTYQMNYPKAVIGKKAAYIDNIWKERWKLSDGVGVYSLSSGGGGGPIFYVDKKHLKKSMSLESFEKAPVTIPKNVTCTK